MKSVNSRIDLDFQSQHFTINYNQSISMEKYQKEACRKFIPLYLSTNVSLLQTLNIFLHWYFLSFFVIQFLLLNNLDFVAFLYTFFVFISSFLYSLLIKNVSYVIVLIFFMIFSPFFLLVTFMFLFISVNGTLHLCRFMLSLRKIILNDFNVHLEVVFFCREILGCCTEGFLTFYVSLKVLYSKISPSDTRKPIPNYHKQMPAQVLHQQLKTFRNKFYEIP